MNIAKYRSWSESDKRFYYFLNGGYFMECGTIAHQWRFDWENAEQCTGLEDKNGVEIYEGDIVIHRIYNPVEITSLESFYDMKYDVARYGWDETDDFGFEKIGNIHENTELLEK